MDETELGVSPIQFLLIQIHGQAVGPVDVSFHNDLPVAAIHTCPLNAGLFPPVCPVDVAKAEQESSPFNHLLNLVAKFT